MSADSILGAHPQTNIPQQVKTDGAGALLVSSSGGLVQLASNITLAANSGSTPVTGVKGGVYVWDAQWAGVGTLALQALGSDGATWREVATLASGGTFLGEIRIGSNATVRLFNKNANGGVSFTGLYSSLS